MQINSAKMRFLFFPAQRRLSAAPASHLYRVRLSPLSSSSLQIRWSTPSEGNFELFLNAVKPPRHCNSLLHKQGWTHIWSQNSLKVEGEIGESGSPLRTPASAIRLMNHLTSDLGWAFICANKPDPCWLEITLLPVSPGSARLPAIWQTGGRGVGGGVGRVGGGCICGLCRLELNFGCKKW